MLLPILLVNFIGTMGFSIVLPFLVFLVEDFSGNALLFGAMAAVYPFFQLIGAPLLGKWSDVYGRRLILLVSQAGTLSAWGLLLVALFLPIVPLVSFDSNVFGPFFISLPFIMLLLARALDGVTGGNISVANAYVADVSDESDRKKNFGKMAVSSNLGFIVGPALAGLLAATIYGELLPVVTAFGISMVALVIIFWVLPESKPCIVKRHFWGGGLRRFIGQEHKECVDSASHQKIRFRDIIRLPLVPFLLVLVFLIFLGFNFFYTAFPIHAVQTLRWSIPELGVFFAVLSGLMAVVQGPVLGRISSRVSDSVLIVAGGVLLGFNFVLFFFTDILLIYLAAVLFALGNGLMWPSFLSFLSKKAGSMYQGSVQGLASSFGSVASIVGLLAGGVFYAFFKSYTFLLSALIIFLVVVFSLRFMRTDTKTDAMEDKTVSKH